MIFLFLIFKMKNFSLLTVFLYCRLRIFLSSECGSVYAGGGEEINDPTTHPRQNNKSYTDLFFIFRLWSWKPHRSEQLKSSNMIWLTGFSVLLVVISQQDGIHSASVPTANSSTSPASQQGLLSSMQTMMTDAMEAVISALVNILSAAQIGYIEYSPVSAILREQT